jgi:hypothetical protein
VFANHVVNAQLVPRLGVSPYKCFDAARHGNAHRLSLQVVPVDQVGGLTGWQLRVDDLRRPRLFYLGQDKVCLHVVDGAIGYLLSIQRLSMSHSSSILWVWGDNHDGLGNHALEVHNLFAARRREHVRLIQDVVSPPLRGKLEQHIEALGAHPDEDIPPATVVSLPGKPVYFHAVDQIVGAEYVELLLRVLALVVLGPVRFARAGEANHQEDLNIM